jgi:Eco29kI restriction endonuclease
MPKTLAPTPTDSQPVLDCNVFEEEALRAHELFVGSPYYKLHKDNLPTEDRPGVYAVYYRGPHPLYYVWAVLLVMLPLYIGKTSTSIRDRLKKHIESILAVERAGGGLRLEDFEFRFFSVPKGRGWIAEGLEGWFIEHYEPLWNGGRVKGFGNNPQGKERGTTTRAGWDLAHPGRNRSQNENDTLTAADVFLDILAAGKELLVKYGLASEIGRYEEMSLASIEALGLPATPVPAANIAPERVKMEQGQTLPLFPEPDDVLYEGLDPCAEGPDERATRRGSAILGDLPGGQQYAIVHDLNCGQT